MWVICAHNIEVIFLDRRIVKFVNHVLEEKGLSYTSVCLPEHVPEHKVRSHLSQSLSSLAFGHRVRPHYGGRST